MATAHPELWTSKEACPETPQRTLMSRRKMTVRLVLESAVPVSAFTPFRALSSKKKSGSKEEGPFLGFSYLHMRISPNFTFLYLNIAMYSQLLGFRVVHFHIPKCSHIDKTNVVIDSPSRWACFSDSNIKKGS